MSCNRPTSFAHAATALVVLISLCLGTILFNDFVGMDDNSYITANPRVLQGLTIPGAIWAFTARERSNWHPLTWLSHQLDVTVFGVHPAGHHLVGLLLHICNALLLFAALWRLTGALWKPALVAALFAVHPLHVESVAWAAERKDLLSTMLMLAALASWSRHLRRRGGGVSVATAGLFAGALMAKPMPVTFPFLLLLLDWWPLGRWAPSKPGAVASVLPGILPPSRLWLEKTPLFLLAAASSAVTYSVQSAAGAVASQESIPVSERAASVVVGYVTYLSKSVWPRNLAIYYPFNAHLPWYLWAGAFTALVGASVLALCLCRRSPWIAAGWFWYLGTLVPVIGFVQAGGQALADRYTYFPLTGIFVACAWTADRWAHRRPLFGVLMPAAATIAVVVLGLLAHLQAGRWRNPETLFRHSLTVAPGSWLLLNNLGSVLSDLGRFPEAEQAYRDALKADPFRALVHNNLGVVLARQGRATEAEQHYRRARRLGSASANGRQRVERQAR